MIHRRKIKIFLLAGTYGFLIALIRVILIKLNIGYAPVDYGVYRNLNNLLHEDLSIYENNVFGTFVNQGLPFVYTPFSAMLLYPLRWVAEPLGIYLWTFTNAILLFYIINLSMKDKHGKKTFFIAIPFSLFNIIAQHFMFGQINIILCFLCIYDILRKDVKFIPKGTLIGVAAGIKLTPALFIIFFLVSRNWRYFFYSSASLISTMIIGYVFTPKNTIDYFTSKIFTLSSVVDLGQNFSTSGNSSIQGVVSRWTGIQDSNLSAIISVFILIMSLITAYHFSQKRDNLATACIIGISSCLLSPVSWLHHWVWAIPSIIWLANYRNSKYSKIIAVTWSSICIFQGTDLGDYLALHNIHPIIYEFFRSSLVLCGFSWISYMLAISLKDRDINKFKAERLIHKK